MYWWVQTKRFVDDSIEECAVCHVFNIEEGFAWRDGIDFFAELSLDAGVETEFIGDP
jgi:hypothetical protein